MLYNMAGPFVDAACLTYEGIAFQLETFPRTKEPVWVLGRVYNTQHGDLENLNNDVRTRLWFTYRKNFQAIGGTGPTADTGWGCMLRCGQMIFAQALMCRHLSRDWQWDPDCCKNKTYMQILQSFLDKKDSLYSIHQIAQMGVSEGKTVGSWFGPNTVAQVLKKLTAFDDWSSMCVHVAMDNTVIIEDIKTLCKRDSAVKSSAEPTRNNCTTLQAEQRHVHQAEGSNDTCHLRHGARVKHAKSSWKPLLLFIPLRLGLSEMNPVYNEPFKACFTFPQSLGVIGGKPNHAYYFIGYYSNYLLYLDPHTTQTVVNTPLLSQIPDETFHCVYPCRMNIADLDPSIALGFFCHTEEDFDNLCDRFTTAHLLFCFISGDLQHIIEGKKLPMFELVLERPPHWPSLEIPKGPGEDFNSSTQSDFTELCYTSSEEKEFDTDGEYEIL